MSGSSGSSGSSDNNEGMVLRVMGFVLDTHESVATGGR